MKQIISDELWHVIQNCIPVRKSKVGRPHTDCRQVLNGIAYVLRNGIYWHHMPKEFGKPSTIHGIFMKWTRAGIFEAMYNQIRSAYQIQSSDNNWYAIDTSSKKAPFANTKFAGNNPTDRSKKGIKQGFIVDRKGIPVMLLLAPANIHDSNLLEPLLQEWAWQEVIRILAADAAFDVKKLRTLCKKKNIALIAVTNPRRNKKLQKTKVPYRWVVERTIGWLSWYRGLKTCWAKLLESHLSFLQLACSIQTFRSL
jgi:transposase